MIIIIVYLLGQTHCGLLYLRKGPLPLPQFIPLACIFCQSLQFNLDFGVLTLLISAF